MADLTIALAGNPNAGKTTIFNALTGLRQHTGNWPGKTVEKKEGEIEHSGLTVNIVDLPGTYSLTAYSPEEIIARDYIIQERPDVVINVVDASTCCGCRSTRCTRAWRGRRSRESRRQILVDGLWGGDATIGEKGTYQELALSATSEHRLVFRAGPAGAPNPAESGGTVGVGVLVRDTLGHALSHAWSALCPGLSSGGSFQDASRAVTLWTAPANLTGDRQACTLTVQVGDGQGLSESRSYSQGVLALPDRVSLVSGPAGTPNPVASGGLVTLSAAARDSYGHAVNFAWSAQCTGLEGNGSFATANGTTTWRAPGNYTGERRSAGCRWRPPTMG